MIYEVKRLKFFWYDNDKDHKVCFLVTRVMFAHETLDIMDVEGEIEDFTELTQLEPNLPHDMEGLDTTDPDGDMTGLTPPLQATSPILHTQPQVGLFKQK